jgi:DNA modification methylase
VNPPRVITGRSELVLPTLARGSADALVTDPPAGIAFMGKEWDRFRRARNPADVGRDSVHGRMSRSAPASGAEGKRGPFIAALQPVFEEALRVLTPGAHAIVWALPRTSHWTALALEDAGFEIRDCAVHLQAQGFPKSSALLKPAGEHWILARTPGPLRELDIDGCRIGDEPGRWPANVTLEHAAGCELVGQKRVRGSHDGAGAHLRAGHDRWRQMEGRADRPAAGGTAQSHTAPDGTETVADWRCTPDCPVRMLDEQSGERVSHGGKGVRGARSGTGLGYGGGTSGATVCDAKHDRGGASRFFYCAKAKGAEREGNPHPTAKPVGLMRWLVRLVTPVGGTVLDPFMGSGTTGVAAVAEGRGFVGIEREDSYAAKARGRIATALGPLFAKAVHE